LGRHRRAADFRDEFVAQVFLLGLDRRLQLLQASSAQRTVGRPIGYVESPARGRDGPLHVLRLRGGSAAEHQAGGGAEVVELFTGDGRHQFTVDEHSGFGPLRRPPAHLDAGLGPLFDVAHLHLYNRTMPDDQL
jgi:hypothetical protein